MQEAAERDAKTEYENALIDTAVNNAKMDVPPVMIEDRITQMVEEIKLNLESRKMTMDQYMEYTGMDMAKLREAQREGAEKNVRTDLVLDAIAKAFGRCKDHHPQEQQHGAASGQHPASQGCPCNFGQRKIINKR